MCSESAADRARRTKARSKSSFSGSFSGSAPNLVKMLSLFVLRVIKSRQQNIEATVLPRAMCGTNLLNLVPEYRYPLFFMYEDDLIL